MPLTWDDVDGDRLARNHLRLLDAEIARVVAFLSLADATLAWAS